MTKKTKTGNNETGEARRKEHLQKKLGLERQQTDRQAQGLTPVIPHHKVEVGDPDYTLRPCLN